MNTQLVVMFPLVEVPAMFASRHLLMTQRGADDQWRQVFDDIMYQVIKGN
jgi:hypothetical protein